MITMVRYYFGQLAFDFFLGKEYISNMRRRLSRRSVTEHTRSAHRDMPGASSGSALRELTGLFLPISMKGHSHVLTKGTTITWSCYS